MYSLVRPWIDPSRCWFWKRGMSPSPLMRSVYSAGRKKNMPIAAIPIETKMTGFNRRRKTIIASITDSPISAPRENVKMIAREQAVIPAAAIRRKVRLFSWMNRSNEIPTSGMRIWAKALGLPSGPAIR